MNLSLFYIYRFYYSGLWLVAQMLDAGIMRIAVAGGKTAGQIKWQLSGLTNDIFCNTMYYKEVMNMTFSIRLTEDERRLADSYAKLHSLSVGDAFKRALFEKIEDEYDIAVAKEREEAYQKDPVTYSHEEVWKELLE